MRKGTIFFVFDIDNFNFIQIISLKKKFISLKYALILILYVF